MLVKNYFNLKFIFGIINLLTHINKDVFNEPNKTDLNISFIK